MNLPAVLLLLAIQDPSPQERLATELHGKVLKLGPLSFKVQMEAVDSKEKKTLKHEMDVYLSLGDGSFAVRKVDIKADEPVVREYSTWDKFDEIRMWTQESAGYRFRFGPIWTWMHQLDSDLQRLVEPEKKLMSFEDWYRSTPPMLTLDCDPDPAGSSASFMFGIGKAKSGEIRWLKLLKRARPGEMEANPEVVVIKDDSGAKTTTVDRSTGFLKSIRVNLKSGEARLVSIVGFKTGATKPAYAAPDVRERWIRPEDTPTLAADMYQANLGKGLQSILDHWDELGKDGSKSGLSSFLSTLGARHEIAIRFARRRYWTDQFLDWSRTQGEELPAPDGDVRGVLESLTAYIKKGEEKHAERFEEEMGTFVQSLERQIATSKAPAEAKTALTVRLREAMGKKNVAAARARLKEPELEELLRETLRKDASKD